MGSNTGCWEGRKTWSSSGGRGWGGFLGESLYKWRPKDLVGEGGSEERKVIQAEGLICAKTRR